MFPRIPRNSQWLYDNIYAGRAATRCFSTLYGNYWWPRRKADRGRDCKIYSEQRKDTLKRRYNGQAAERRNIHTPEEIPFVKGFPRQSEGSKNLSPNIPPNEVSHLQVVESQDQSRPDIGDVEEPEHDINGDPINTGTQILPTSDKTVEATSDEQSRGIEASQNSMEDPGDDIKETSRVIDHSDSSLDTIIGSNATTLDDLDDPTECLMNERKSVLQSIAHSQETEPPLEERRKWVPLAELENANEELQNTLALGENIDLNLGVDTESHTIHILGTGSIGKYIAHALARLSDAPTVTLLMHRPLLIQQWHEEGANIQLLKNGKISTESNFNIESSANIQRESPKQRFPGFGKNLEHTVEPPNTVIDSLIVTTEGHTTVSALSAIKHRLRHTSTICFIQDGLGVANLVDSMVFPDPASRPSYMLGNMSHDLLSTERKFTLVEKRLGRISLTMAPRTLAAQDLKRGLQKNGILVRRMDYRWTPTSKFLMRTLSRTPELSAIGLAQTEFYEMQLQKLAINSVIGPLSVMYDCFNDELLCNYQVSRSIKLLLKEIATILQSLPEVSRAVKIEKRFGAEKLEKIIVGVLGKTGKNATTMLQAVRKGKRTDIDFYNGYLVSRAKELGIDCPHLEMMVAMVKGKQAMKSRERNTLIPFKV